MRLRSKLTLVMMLLASVLLLGLAGVVYFQQERLLDSQARENRVMTANYAVSVGIRRSREACSELLGIGRVLVPRTSQQQAIEKDLTAVLEAAQATQLRKQLFRTQRKLLLDASFREAQSLYALGIYNRGGALVEARKQSTFPSEVPSLLAPALLERASLSHCRYLPVIWRGEQSFLPMVVPIARPENKRVYAYLWAAMPVEPIYQDLRHFAREIGDSVEVFVVDAGLRILAHANPKMRGKLADRTIFLEGVTFERDTPFGKRYVRGGKPYLSFVRPMAAYGWGVVVLQPEERAFAALYKLTRMTWISLLLGILAALLAGLFLGYQLARPVLAVADAAEKVAGGDFSVRVPSEVMTRDEVGEMAISFNKMAGDLASYREQVIKEAEIRHDLSRYLSADLVDGIVNGEIDLQLGGERKKITVMFADIVAFTPLAEKQSPEKVVALLNEVFTIMTEIIFRHGGTVDKFLGDCVMAVFGAPYSRGDDAPSAVSAAEEMLQWLESGNARWRSEFGVELQMGIGINTGEALAGNIGSQKRMEYTVIGDTVNVAARLETLARPGQILMTQQTAAEVEEDFELESLGVHSIVGRAEGIEVFT
ncbi:MAG: HAMP domain-containing protein, partial [Myxococcales bacterium]|nr:HAMP domain-containing protein [Myxococcales bacterium]